MPKKGSDIMPKIKWDNWDLLRQDINKIETPLDMVKKTKNNILIVKKFKNPPLTFAFSAPEWFDVNSLQYSEDTTSRKMIVDILSSNLIYKHTTDTIRILSNGKLIKDYYKIKEVDDKELEDYILKEMI